MAHYHEISSMIEGDPGGHKTYSGDQFSVTGAQPESDVYAFAPFFSLNQILPPLSPYSVVLPFDFVDQMYERIWVSPNIYDAGFIVEEKQTDIEVWNAYRKEQKTISAVVGVNTSGTLLDISPPIDLEPTEAGVYTLTVYQAGPATQNTIFTFTVGGDDYDLKVIGVRVVPFLPEPEWGSTVKFGMRFENVVLESEYLAEQRRPLADDAIRSAVLDVTIEGHHSEEVINNLLYGHDKVMGIPVYHEPIYVNSITQGVSSITASNDITAHWHMLNYAQFAVIVDHSRLLGEIKSVTDVTPPNITFGNDIIEDYPNANLVRCYPIFLALIKGMRVTSETDQHVVIAVEFEELTSGG